MKLLKLIPGAAIALTVLIPLKANADYPPNGWSQVGKYCQKNPHLYYKLQKNSNKSVYGVYREDDDEGSAVYKWTLKDVTLQEANQKMNDACGVDSYQPT